MAAVLLGQRQVCCQGDGGCVARATAGVLPGHGGCVAGRRRVCCRSDGGCVAGTTAGPTCRRFWRMTVSCLAHCPKRFLRSRNAQMRQSLARPMEFSSDGHWCVSRCAFVSSSSSSYDSYELLRASESLSWQPHAQAGSHRKEEELVSFSSISFTQERRFFYLRENNSVLGPGTDPQCHNPIKIIHYFQTFPSL